MEVKFIQVEEKKKSQVALTSVMYGDFWIEFQIKISKYI